MLRDKVAMVCHHLKPKSVSETTCFDADQAITEKPRKYWIIEPTCGICNKIQMVRVEESR